MFLNLLCVPFSCSQSSFWTPPQKLSTRRSIKYSKYEAGHTLIVYLLKFSRSLHSEGLSGGKYKQSFFTLVIIQLFWIWSLSTHPPHDGDGLGWEEPWVADFIVDDAVKHLLLIITGEGRLKRETCQDEKDEDMTTAADCESLTFKHESKATTAYSYWMSAEVLWNQLWMINSTEHLEETCTHLPDQHLKDQDAEPPPVHSTSVRRFSQNLRS